MSGVLSYINDPNGTGVYCASFSISMLSLQSLFQEICKYSSYPERFKLSEEKELKRLPGTYIAKIAMEDLTKALDYLSIIGHLTKAFCRHQKFSMYELFSQFRQKKWGSANEADFYTSYHGRAVF